MSRLWLFLWIALLACYILTGWIVQRLSRPVPDWEFPLSSDLVELAVATNDHWEQLMPLNHRDAPRQGGAREVLLQREALIMELRKMEREMIEQGVETQIVQDLEAFMATLQGMESARMMNQYIKGLLEWMGPSSTANRECRMERIFLHPSGNMDLPALGFELSGRPVPMGKRLRESFGPARDWWLLEMDIVANPLNDNLWMRGSCLFQGSFP